MECGADFGEGGCAEVEGLGWWREVEEAVISDGEWVGLCVRLCGELVVDWTANCISFQSSILKMGCCSGSEPTRNREYGILPTLPENVHALDLPISPTTN